MPWPCASKASNLLDAQAGRVQLNLQLFFRPKAPAVFDAPVAAAPAALVEPEPHNEDVSDKNVANWLLSLAGQEEILNVDSESENECIEVLEDPVDAALTELLDGDLTSQVSQYVTAENRTQCQVWSQEEKLMVLQIYAKKKNS